MATLAEFRRAALAQPQAIEKSHFGQPDFRVEGKIFAGLQPDKDIGVMKLGPERMLALVREDDTVFTPARGFERGGWTLITLSGISAARLRELMPLAWATVAPKRLQSDATPKARKTVAARKDKKA